MALSAAILQSAVGATGVGAVPAVSASFTPPAGALLLAFFGVVTFYSTTDPTPVMTITDSTGLIWTLVGASGDTINFSSGLVVYRAVVGLAPVPMTVTGALGGGLSSSAARLSVVSYTGFKTAAPIAQVLQLNRGAGFPNNDGRGAWSYNLASPPLATSEVLACELADGSAPGTASPGAGWTLLDGYAAISKVVAIESRRGSVSPTVDWNLTAIVIPAYKNNSVTIEVAAAGGGASSAAGVMPTFIPGL